MSKSLRMLDSPIGLQLRFQMLTPMFSGHCGSGLQPSSWDLMALRLQSYIQDTLKISLMVCTMLCWVVHGALILELHVACAPSPKYHIHMLLLVSDLSAMPENEVNTINVLTITISSCSWRTNEVKSPLSSFIECFGYVMGCVTNMSSIYLSNSD